jgi:hypothetical protein
VGKELGRILKGMQVVEEERDEKLKLALSCLNIEDRC